MLQEVKFLTPPAMMIISGASGPIHTQRPLAIITLGSPSGRLSPMMFNWKPTLFDDNNRKTLVVDVPEGHRWKTFKLLGEYRIPGLVHIDSPKPSAGNSKTDPRPAIHCHFGVGIGLSMEKEMLRKMGLQSLGLMIHLRSRQQGSCSLQPHSAAVCLCSPVAAEKCYCFPFRGALALLQSKERSVD